MFKTGLQANFILNRRATVKSIKKLAIGALAAVLFSLINASIGLAQVKRIEMKIDGYLCGN